MPGAIEWLLEWQKHNVRIILWTMRSEETSHGDTLSPARQYLESHGVKIWAVNCNPEQHTWTKSSKQYHHLLVDDCGAMIPLRDHPRAGSRPCVDWGQVGPWVLNRIQQFNQGMKHS